MLIDCKLIAEGIEIPVTAQGRTLGIVHEGYAEDTKWYIKSIVTQCKLNDIQTHIYRIVNEDSLHWLPNFLNACDKVIFVKPFGSKYTEKLKLMIPPRKDIDNYTGKSPYKDSTAEAVRYLLEKEYEYRFDRGDKAVVIGAGVGRAIANELIDMGFTTVVFNSESDRILLDETCYSSRVIVSAVGKPWFKLHKSSVSPNTVIIDVGNDVSEELTRIAKQDIYDNLELTPQVNGIGLITTKMLLRKVGL